MFDKSKQRKITTAILRWYAREGRRLPWRLSDGKKRINQYRILVSEIMLQQTQVRRVLIKYPLFLKKFPNLQALASAPQRDVVMAWQGMGYNNRAVRLHKLARVVMKEHRGQLPDESQALIKLPGIGKYTANALLSARGGKIPVVDVNVQRVLSRIFWKMPFTAHVRPLDEMWKLAETLLPRGRAYRWNQALMDLGATVCTARKPACEACPAALYCASRTVMAWRTVRQPKREPSLNGIPNRIYRGHLVERLRVDGTKTAEYLGRQILPTFSKQHSDWLQKLLAGLQKDGIITIRGNRSLKTQRVSLA